MPPKMSEIAGAPLWAFANQSEPIPSPRVSGQRRSQTTASSDRAASAGFEVLIHHRHGDPDAVGDNDVVRGRPATYVRVARAALARAQAPIQGRVRRGHRPSPRRARHEQRPRTDRSTAHRAPDWADECWAQAVCLRGQQSWPMAASAPQTASISVATTRSSQVLKQAAGNLMTLRRESNQRTDPLAEPTPCR